jgi:peptidyl-prolyl cis-trans isomerase C
MFVIFKKLASEPLLHFLLIGAGIYGLYGMFATGEAGNDERTVTVTSGEIQALADQWRQKMNRPQTEDEFDGIIRNRVRVQILHREALAMGLDKGDTFIEQRLAQKVEFLAQGLITPEEPSDEELIDWYAANSDRFKQPDLYTIAQIFFDPDKREATISDDAKATLERLNALDRLPPDLGDYGDRLMIETYYANISMLELGRLFGTAFAEEVIKLEAGAWHGPILSGYGAHLVFINDIVLMPLPAFDDIRERLNEEWLAEQVTELSERFIDSLVSRYEVVVEETEVPISTPASGASQ